MILPENTETTKYVPSSWEEEISLIELLGLAAGFFPQANDLSEISISHQEIQVKCFGYDLYDSSDYRWYWVFNYIGEYK